MLLHNDPHDIQYREAVQLQTRAVSREDIHKFEGYAAEMLSTLGMDLNTPATKGSPRRFIKALFDATTAGLTLVTLRTKTSLGFPN